MKRSRSPEEPRLDSPDSDAEIANSDGDLHKVNNSSSSNAAMYPASKITELDPSSNGSANIGISCSLPPHKEPVVFSSYEEYEAHYRNQHTNRCLECRKNFPSARLLGLHIEETHDSFAAVKREKGERTYACFVDGCDKVCRDPHKRKMHLIAKHMYPKNFFFGVTRDGIDGRRSLLLEGNGPRRRRSSAASSSTAQPPSAGSMPAKAPDKKGQKSGTVAEGSAHKNFEESPETHPHVAPAEAAAHLDEDMPTEQKPDVEMEDLSAAISQLQFVPRSVRFGRGGKKSGFAKR